MNHRVGNTDKRILAAASHERWSGVTTLDIVNRLWPTSKQPMKKCRTVQAYVRRLLVAGLLRDAGGRYFVTPTSRAAYYAPIGSTAGPMMRLAT